MARIKGSEKTGGRKPGSLNKITKDINEALIESFDILGGVNYLVEQGKANPVAYMSLLGKKLPKDVNNNVTLNKSELLQEIVANLPK